MTTRHITAAALVLATAVVAAPAVPAEDQPVKRTELMRVPIEGAEGKEGVVFTAEFAPGAVSARHSHPGQEFIYVLEGSLVLEPENPDKAPAVTLKEGETAMHPANEVHVGKNPNASAPAKVLVFMIAATDQPLAVQAE